MHRDSEHHVRKPYKFIGIMSTINTLTRVTVIEIYRHHSDRQSKTKALTIYGNLRVAPKIQGYPCRSMEGLQLHGRPYLSKNINGQHYGYP